MRVISVGDIKTGRSSTSFIMRKHWGGTTQDRCAVSCAQAEAGLWEPVIEKLTAADYYSNFPWCNLHSQWLEHNEDPEYLILHPVRPDPVDWVESYAGHVLSLSPARKTDGYMWYPAVRSWEPIVTPQQAIDRHAERDAMIHSLYKEDPNYLQFSYWDGTNINELSERVGEFARHNHVVHENANRLKNYGNEEWLEANIEEALSVAKHIGTYDTARAMIDRVIARYL